MNANILFLLKYTFQHFCVRKKFFKTIDDLIFFIAIAFYLLNKFEFPFDEKF